MKYYINIIDIIVYADIAKSKSEARRLINQNAVKIHLVDQDNTILQTKKINNIYYKIIFEL